MKSHQLWLRRVPACLPSQTHPTRRPAGPSTTRPRGLDLDSALMVIVGLDL